MGKQTKNKVETSNKLDILTPRMIKARERAAMILQGASYTETALATGMSKKKPIQSMYQHIHSKTGQDAMAHVAGQYYDKAKLRRLLNDMLESKKTPSGVKVRAIELGMRSEAMLTDKQERKDMTREEKDLGQYTEAELHKALLDRIRDSQDAA